MLLLTAAGLSIFLVLSAMMSVSLYMGRSDALEMSRKMGETVSGFARDASEQNARQHLLVAAEARAQHAERAVSGVGTDNLPDVLRRFVQEKSFGNDGVNFVLDEKGCVVVSTEREGMLAASADRDLRLASEPGLAKEAAAMTEGKSGVAPVSVDGREYNLAYAPLPSIGWSFGMMEKVSSAAVSGMEIRRTASAEAVRFVASLNRLFLENFLYMTALLCLIMCALFYFGRRTTRRIVEPILALDAGVQEIAKGNLDKKLDVKSGDEIERLAASVNKMTDDLKTYMENLARVTAEKERIATELSLARDIQEGMLPPIFPDFSDQPHFDLFASMEAARDVGGDFYDFYMLDDSRLVLTIADVSDKGIPAALFMVISKTLLKNAALSGAGAANYGRMMAWTNRQLCENNKKKMFVTVFFGVLDLKTGEFVYMNAGHCAPLIGHETDGRTEWNYLKDKRRNLMIGAVAEAAYEERRLTLAPGDMLFLYTDGVTEAMDGEGQLYTKGRLKETLDRIGTPDAKAEQILAAVRADIAAHVGGAEQSDDVTMMAVRFLG